MENLALDQDALRLALIELKLLVNRRLFEKGVISQQMHTKAKEVILKG